MKTMLARLFAPTAPLPPRFCKDCRYYKPDPALPEPMHGLCTKDPKINMVDGTTEYKNVAIVREFTCKGQWWETREDTP